MTSGPVTIDPNSDNAPGALTGKPTACYIYFPPSFTKNLSWVPGSYQYDALYHEVFHCYQFFVLGQQDLSVAYAAPEWLIEGSAEWAGDSMSAYDDPTWAATLSDNTAYGYLNNPRTSLASKAHEAFGLFYEVEYLGRPLWPQWWGIFTSADSGGWTTTDWFDAVAGDQMTALTDAWGSSYFEQAGLGHDWAETASNQTTNYQGVASLFSGSLGVSASPYSTYQVTIPAQSSGDLVVILTSSGTPRYIDSAGQQAIGDDTVALCWGTCDTSKCPSDAGNPRPDVTNVTGEVDWALTALDDGGTAQLAEVSTDQFCKQTPTPNSNQPPCSWSCAGSNGDPHVMTVSRAGYTFQAAGEYVLLRSPTGDIQIQERQEPWGQKTTTTASDNTAVAAVVGTHHVGVYANGGSQNFVVEVDGAPVSLTTPMSLSGGGKVSRETLQGSPLGIEVDFPDGTKLWALYTEAGEKYGINIEIAPTPALRADAVGLLGVIPMGDMLPALPSGMALPATTTPQAAYTYEYQTFAPAWRVTPSDSLFVYDAGKTTASYNYPGFVPEGGPPPMLLDALALAAANTTCSAVGDVELHDDCIYDVTATGDTGFATQYAQTDAFATKSGTPASGTTAPPPTGALLHALLPNVSHLNGMAVGPDGTLYILIYQATANKASIIAVDPTTTTILRQAAVSTNPVPNGLAFSSGSLWFISTQGQQCSVAEVDPTSLSVTATLAMPQCPTLIGGATTAEPSGLAIAAAGDEVWVCDGPDLLQVDMAGKTFSQRIPTGSVIFGSLIASATTVFWMNEVGVSQVDASTSSLNQIDGGVDVGEVLLPSGDGVWEQGGGGTAFFVDNADTGPSAPITIGGTPIGADQTNIFSEDPTTHQVAEHPATGGSGTTLGTSSLEADAPPLLIGTQNAFRVFTQSPQAGQPFTLYVENFPLQ